MFDSLEANNEIDRAAYQRDAGTIPGHETYVVCLILFGGMSRDSWLDVHAYNPIGHLGQQSGTITFPTRNIQDNLAFGKLLRYKIPMLMFQLDAATKGRNVAFTSRF
jgi:hypothetical protein